MLCHNNTCILCYYGNGLVVYFVYTSLKIQLLIIYYIKHVQLVYMPDTPAGVQKRDIPLGAMGLGVYPHKPSQQAVCICDLCMC